MNGKKKVRNASRVFKSPIAVAIKGGLQRVGLISS